MRKIFISYSRQDQTFALQLAAAMKDTQVLGLTDPENLSSAESLSLMLRMYVRSADAVVALLSENARTSKWVIFEVGVAQGFEKVVIPVLLPGAPFEGSLPEILKGVQVLDARNLTMTEVAMRLSTLI